MRGPFERCCAEVTDTNGTECLSITTSSISDKGHESLWCGNGHKVKEWYVIDADGKKIALANMHKSPQILDEDMMEKLSIDPMFRQMAPPKPDRMCIRGHNDWYMNPDERYRCRQCKRDSYLKNRLKLKAKRDAKKRGQGKPVAKKVFHKKRGRKKNVRNKA